MTEKEKFIEGLYKDLNYSISRFDSQTLVISAGALGFSLTFIQEIVPFENSICVGILYIAIGLFIGTMSISFIAHYISATQILDTIAKVNKDEIDKIMLDKRIPIINKAIVWLLMLGILFLVVYCIINIEHLKRIL